MPSKEAVDLLRACRDCPHLTPLPLRRTIRAQREVVRDIRNSLAERRVQLSDIGDIEERRAGLMQVDQKITALHRELDKMEEAQETVLSALSHFERDYRRAAEQLGVDLGDA